MIEKIIRITNCKDCPNREVETAMGRCDHSCYYEGNYMGFIYDGAGYSIPEIPKWCPLEGR